MKRSSRLDNDPRAEEIYQRHLDGAPLKDLAVEYGYPTSTLSDWLAQRREDDGREAGPKPPPRQDTDRDFVVSGGFRGDGDGEFSWKNVSDVPTDEEVRYIIRLNGSDPDDFTWYVSHINFAVSRNDTAWRRDPDAVGTKDSAYTGLSAIKRGEVRIRIERKKVSSKEREILESLPRIHMDGPREWHCATCGSPFEPKRSGNVFCSKACRTPGARKRADLGTITHVLIPDTQVGPGRPTDHLLWIGQYLHDRYHGMSLTLVHIGDHWDMHSLSSYDAGTGKMEGRRYVADVEAGNRAFEVLDEPIKDEPLWRKEFLDGNHEKRIERAANQSPQLDGLISMDSLILPSSWGHHKFLDVLQVDGVYYSHYFMNHMNGKPLGGESVETRLKNIGHTFVMGHQQGLKIGMRYVAGKQQVGVVAGSCYQHDEEYKGTQGNAHWRGIVVLNNVVDGSFDPMPVSLDYLCRRYEGHRLDEHTGRVV